MRGGHCFGSGQAMGAQTAGSGYRQRYRKLEAGGPTDTVQGSWLRYSGVELNAMRVRTVGGDICRCSPGS
jgi:hypothetical protein